VRRGPARRDPSFPFARGPAAGDPPIARLRVPAAAAPYPPPAERSGRLRPRGAIDAPAAAVGPARAATTRAASRGGHHARLTRHHARNAPVVMSA